MGKVVSVNTSTTHDFSKQSVKSIFLIKDQGVKDDAHCGALVKHRSRVKKDPNQANLRQVHLIHQELIDELNANGFNVQPGTMGENITTSGIDLLALPTGALLIIGDNAIVRITGLRNPCKQLNDYQQGLMAQVLDKDGTGKLIRKAGVMGVVFNQGRIKVGDQIRVELPETPQLPLKCV